MRNAFAETIIKIILEDPKVILLMGDTGAGLYDELFEKVPNQIINTGIAEANMVTVASGLSKEGFIPFVYAIGAHLVYRAFEQIRNDICLNNSNVKLISVGSGIHYSDHGPTHHTTEDFSVLRCLPNIKIISPSGKHESSHFTKIIYRTPGPFYLRLGRGKDTIKDYIPNLGTGQLIRDGKDITIFVTGSTVSDVYNLINFFVEQKIDVRIINIHTIKPLDNKIIEEAANETPSFLVVEEHQKIGGLAEAISSVLAILTKKVKFSQIGIEDKFCVYTGSYDGIKSEFGLSNEAIKDAVIDLVKPKKS